MILNYSVYYLEFLPVFVFGFFCGIARFARLEVENEEKKDLWTRFFRAIDIILTSGFICVIIYAMLSYFDELTYILRVGLAATFALFGVDKALEFFHKILELKRGKNEIKD